MHPLGSYPDYERRWPGQGSIGAALLARRGFQEGHGCGGGVLAQQPHLPLPGYDSEPGRCLPPCPLIQFCFPMPPSSFLIEDLATSHGVTLCVPRRGRKYMYSPPWRTPPLPAFLISGRGLRHWALWGLERAVCALDP
ncbi:hypothetical protein IMZ48_07210 [Candidatus Bathyarchaeota archaeon]|nr:hypothetical protein [Candidatus Bathyarchaeota archaeon]